MTKVVDIDWIVDKSLDVYCSSLKENILDNCIKTRCCHGSIMKILSSVLDESISFYANKYDRIFVVVPCHPAMRSSSIHGLYRFKCLHDDVLSNIGVSSSQFLDYVEKFISRISIDEYYTKYGSCDNCFILNGRKLLMHDWHNAIIRTYGSSLVDDQKREPFDDNPGFVSTMEGNLNLFSKTSAELTFRMDEILKKLT